MMNVTVEANVSDVTAAAANASTSDVESAAGYDSMRNLERIVSITGIMCTYSLTLIWVSEWLNRNGHCARPMSYGVYGMHAMQQKVGAHHIIQKSSKLQVGSPDGKKFLHQESCL